MKQKLLLPLLLLLLTCLGVKAAEVTTETLTFDRFNNTNVWESIFAPTTNGQTSTAKIKEGQAGTNAPAYTLQYTGVMRNNNGTVRFSGTNDEATNGIGTLTLPKFNKKVVTLIFDNIPGGQSSAIQVYDVNEMPAVPLTEIIDMSKQTGTITVPINGATVSSQLQIRVAIASYVDLKSIQVVLENSEALSPGLQFELSDVLIRQNVDEFVVPILECSQALKDALNGKKIPVTYTVKPEDSNVVKIVNNVPTLGGSTGNAVVTATFKATEINGEQFESGSTSFKVVVYNPNDAISLPKSKLPSNASLKSGYSDPSESVMFTFGSQSSTYASFNASNDYVRFYPNNTVTVSLQRKDWVIDSIEVKCGSSPAAKFQVKANNVALPTPDPAGNTLTWTFNGVEARSATIVGLEAITNAGITINDIIVKIRKPLFTLEPLSEEVNVEAGQVLNLVNYFKISNTLADYPVTTANLSYSTTGNAVGTVDETRKEFTVNGNAVINNTQVIKAVYPADENSPYGSVEAEFTVKVVGLPVLTLTLKENSVILGDYTDTTCDILTGATMRVGQDDIATEDIAGYLDFEVDPKDALVTVDGNGKVTVNTDGLFDDGKLKTTLPATVKIKIQEKNSAAYEMVPMYFTVTVEDNRLDPKVTVNDLTSNNKIIEILPLTNTSGTLTASVTNIADGANPSISWNKVSDTNGIFKEFNADGSYILSGDPGTAKVQVSVGETKSNKEASAEFTFVVGNPKGNLELNPTAQGLTPGTSMGTAPFYDAANLVAFTFGKAEGTSSVSTQFNKEQKVQINKNNTLTIALTDLAKGYYIKNVTFTGATVNGDYVTVNPGDFANGEWTFDSSNTTTAKLTYTGDASVNLTNITVTLRRKLLAMEAKSATVSVQYVKDGTYEAAQNFIAYDPTIEPKTPITLSGITYSSSDSKYPIEKGTDKVQLTVAGSSTTISANFGGNDEYEAANASFVLEVTEEQPIVIDVTKVPKTINLYPTPETIYVLKDIVTTPKYAPLTVSLPTSEDEESGAGDAESDNDPVVIVADKGEVTANALGTATIEVNFAGGKIGESDTEYAATKATFDITVVDNRTKLQLGFSSQTAQYDLNGNTAFAAPTLTGLANLSADDKKNLTLMWNSSDEDVATVEGSNDGTYSVKFDNFTGVKTVTISVSVPNVGAQDPYKVNGYFTSNTASYTITVIGEPQNLAAPNTTLPASGPVNFRGYIVGGTKGNIIIGANADATSGVNVKVTSTADVNALNVATTPALKGRQIIVYGTATNSNNVTLTKYTLLTTPTFSVIEQTIPANHPEISVRVPNGFNPSDLDILVKTANGDDVDFTLNGSIITLTGVSEGETYKLYIGAKENLPFVAVDPTKVKSIPITIGGDVKSHMQTFTFANKPGVNTIPYIYVVSQSGHVYTPTPEAMTPLAGQYLGYDCQLYEATIEIWDIHMGESYEAPEESEENPEEENAETPKSITKRAPVWGTTDNGSQNYINKEVISPASDSSYPDTDLNVYFGKSENMVDSKGQIIAGEELAAFPSAPVNENIVYTVPGNTKRDEIYIWYWDSTAEKYAELTKLTNNNNSFTPNLYTGSINFTYFSENPVKMIVSTDKNDSDQPTGTIFGAETASDDEAAAEWADNILASNKNNPAPSVDMTDHDSDNEPLTISNANSMWLNISDSKLQKPVAVKVEIRRGGQQVNNKDGWPVYTYEDKEVYKVTNKDETVTYYENVENGSKVVISNPEDLKPVVTTPLYQLGIATDADDISTDVNEIESADGADVMWFNLQGERIAEPSEGIVIRVQGNKSEKVLIRK